jgi:hypothetical protein
MLLRSGIDSMLRKIANVDGCALDMPQRCETCRVLPPIPHDDRRSKLDMGFALAVTMQLEGVKTRLHADTPRVHAASGRPQLNDADMLYTIEVDYLSPPFSRSAEPERSTQIMPMRERCLKNSGPTNSDFCDSIYHTQDPRCAYSSVISASPFVASATPFASSSMTSGTSGSDASSLMRASTASSPLRLAPCG